MKRFIRFSLAIALSLTLALCSAAITHNLPLASQSDLPAALFLQTTPPPEPVNLSQVGSTDGIAIMGFVIVAIVVLAIVVRRKDWQDLR